MSNTKPMYVIIASGGSYDDAWERAEFVTDDVDKGTAYVEKMNALCIKVADASQQLQQWHSHYFALHPMPRPAPCEFLEVPKWSGNATITKQMREERAAIQAENSRRSKVAQQPVMDAYTASNKAINEYKLATFSPEIIDGLEQSYNDTRWEINPIVWLE